MAVFLSYNSQIKPGRRLDAIALAGEGAKLIERHGGGHSRLLLTDVAGEVMDGGVFVTEFDSLDAYGAFADQIANDAEILAIGDRVVASNSPVIPQAQVLAADILAAPTTTTHGSVSEVYIIRVLPGGVEAYVAATQRWADLVLAHGAIAARGLRIVHGGSQSDLYVSVAEYASHQAWGRGTEAWSNTKEGQQLAAQIGTKDLPAQIVSSGLYVEVPL